MDEARPDDRSTRRRRNHAMWLGPSVVLAAGISYFTFFARFPTLRDFPWVNLPVVLAGVGLSILALWRAYRRPDRFRGRILSAVGLTFALLVAGLFGFYIFHLSYMLPGPSAVTLSLSAAPEFELPNHDGRLVDLAGLRGRKVVVTFYRGFW